MEEKDLDQEHRERLRSLYEDGRADRVIAFIQGTEDPELRRKLYSLARQALPERKEPRRLDDLAGIARAGIAECSRQADLARAKLEIDLARECMDSANKLSFNLAADLAECWPGDEVPRERRHFEAGLRAACDCIVWRQELGKPPDRRAMAHWAAGMHQLSLGNRIEALGSFEVACGLAMRAMMLKEAGTAVDDGEIPPDAKVFVKPGADFGTILYYGYAGIASQLLGDEEGALQLEQACAAFQGTIDQGKDPEQVDDAKFGFDQLRWVERKFGESRVPAAAEAAR